MTLYLSHGNRVTLDSVVNAFQERAIAPEVATVVLEQFQARGFPEVAVIGVPESGKPQVYCQMS